MNLRLVVSLLAALTLTGLAGCHTADPAARALPAVTQPSSFDRIAPGMSADEVQALIGKPHVITAAQPAGAAGETWLYLRKVDETVRQIPIGIREVPAVNPITGQSIIIQEPVMTDVFTTLYEDFEVRLVDGRVVKIDRRPRVEEKVH